MTLRLTFLFTIIVANTVAQKTFVGDTVSWYNFKKNQHQQLGLEDLATSKNALTVRFSSSNEVVELSTWDYKVFDGQHVLFTSTNDKENGAQKYISEKRSISPDTAKLLYNLVMQYNILTMPSQEKIKGWNRGIDGMTYVIESSTPRQYAIKKYWSPSVIKNVPEAVLMTEFLSKVSVLLNQKKRLENFFRELAPGCYPYGSMSTRCISHAQKTNLYDIVTAMMNTIMNKTGWKQTAPKLKVPSFS